MKSPTLRRRLLWSLTLMALIPLAAFMVSVGMQVREAREQSLLAVQKTVSLLADDLQEVLFEKHDGLETAAVALRDFRSTHTANKVEVTKGLEANDASAFDIIPQLLHMAGGRYAQTIFVDLDGRVIAAAGLSEEVAEAIRARLEGLWIYRHAQRRAQSAVSEAFEENGRNYVMIAVPVLDNQEGGRRHGVLASRIALHDLIENLAAPQLPAHARLVLREPEGRTLVALGTAESSAPAAVTVPVRSLDCEFAYFAPEGEMLSQAHVTALVGVFMVILIALGAHSAGLLHLRQLSAFFDELSRNIESLRRGEPDIRSQPLAVRGIPEAARILEAFRDMAAGLHRSRAEIRSINASLEERIKARTAELREANTELSAITELLCPITDSEDTLKELREAFVAFARARRLTALSVETEVRDAPADDCEIRASVPGGRTLVARKTAGFSEDDRRALKRFAGFLSVVLTNEDLYRKTQAQHAALRALFSSMSEGFALLGAEGTPVFVNRHFREMLATCEEGREALTALEAGDAHRTEMLGQALANPEHSHALTMEVPGGKTRRFTVRAFPVDLAGDTGAGLLVRDVTREYEIGRLKDDVIALVSHELNNPVSTLALGLETLSERGERLKPEMRQTILRNLSQETVRLRELIGDWLDISMLNNGVLPCFKAPLDLTAFLTDTVSRWEAAKGVHVEWQLPDAPIILSADRKRLEQVVMNLLENALRYNDKAEKKIFVRLEADENRVRLRVEDNGIGLEPEELPLIFERFHRSAKAKRHSPNGSGLGLAICRGIAAAHDGSLMVEHSVPGEGTIMCLTLPRNLQSI